MIYVIQYRMPYDALDARMRVARVPAHDDQEAMWHFRNDYPNAECASIVNCESRDQTAPRGWDHV